MTGTPFHTPITLSGYTCVRAHQILLGHEQFLSSLLSSVVQQVVNGEWWMVNLRICDNGSDEDELSLALWRRRQPCLVLSSRVNVCLPISSLINFSIYHHHRSNFWSWLIIKRVISCPLNVAPQNLRNCWRKFPCLRLDTFFLSWRPEFLLATNRFPPSL